MSNHLFKYSNSICVYDHVYNYLNQFHKHKNQLYLGPNMKQVTETSYILQLTLQILYIIYGSIYISVCTYVRVCA